MTESQGVNAVSEYRERARAREQGANGPLLYIERASQIARGQSSQSVTGSQTGR